MSKDKIRVFQLAQELGVAAQTLIDKLQAFGIDVKRPTSTIDAETRKLAEDVVSGKVKAPPRGTATTAAPARPSVATAPPAPLPPPKARRPAAIPRGKTATTKATEEIPVEAEVQEAPVAEPAPIAAEEVIATPPPVETAPEPAPPAPPPPIQPPRRGPIPAPGGARPLVNLSGQAPPKPGARTAREARMSRPRPVIGVPPVLGTGKLEAPRPTEPQATPQRPVMRLPEALREGGNLADALKPGAIEGDRSAIAEEERKKRGGLTGREERQKRRGQRALARRSLELPEDEEGGPRRLARHRQQRQMRITSRGPVVIDGPITVRAISEAAGVRTNEILRKLMNLGTMVTVNSTLSQEQAELLAMELGLELEFKKARTAETLLDEELVTQGAEEGEQVPRPPIVTFMGHVDHGKTSLMDRIRRTNVAAGEAGGITQHIGAYQVEQNGGLITFLDTPGHEAFTAMRARGANVTDIVVLVVAADDGVKPQTEEAISHAKAANVAIVVAMNKVDLPGANTERVMQQLSTHGLIPEAWGGEIPMIPTSATTGEGIDTLLESIMLLAELRDPPLVANPDRPAIGTCIEASLSEGRGVQATMVVQNGTLHPGDVVVCGTAFGKVRALFDDHNRPLKEAGPSTPVILMGLDEVPLAGEKFVVLADVARAREVSADRKAKSRADSQFARQHITLERFFETVKSTKVEELAIILKADVRGSLEAIKKEVGEFHHPEVKVKIIHEGIGGITESDVLLADASDAIIIGFHVAPETRAQALAAEKGVEIRRYEIIYQVSDDIKKALEGMLRPETREVQLGRAVVQEIFTISRVGTVAGCRVVQGNIERGAKLRIIRDGTVVGTYPIETLRRFKDDVKEVREGMECGIKLAGYDDVKRDDVLEAFKIEEIRRTL